MSDKNYYMDLIKAYLAAGQAGASFFDLCFQGSKLYISFKADNSTELHRIHRKATCLVPSSAISLKDLRYLSARRKDVDGKITSELIGYLTPKKGHKLLVSLLVPLEWFMRYSWAIFPTLKDCRGLISDNAQEGQDYALTYTLKSSFLEELEVIVLWL